MVKYRKAGEHAAYEIGDVTDQDEAAKLGLAVVEVDPTSGRPTAFGRYTNAPDGGPLGVTAAEAPDTKVVAGGEVGPAPDAASAGNKGDIINQNDPVIHGGSDDIHHDGAEPPVEDLEAQRAEATELAEESIEKASKPRKAK